MKQMLEVKHTGQKTENRLDDHALAPRLHCTDLQITRRFARFDKTSVAQRNRVAVELMRQWAKTLVMHIGAIPIPSDDFTSVVDQPAQLGSDNPAAVTFAFLPHLLRA